MAAPRQNLSEYQKLLIDLDKEIIRNGLINDKPIVKKFIEQYKILTSKNEPDDKKRYLLLAALSGLRNESMANGLQGFLNFFNNSHVVTSQVDSLLQKHLNIPKLANVNENINHQNIDDNYKIIYDKYDKKIKLLKNTSEEGLKNYKKELIERSASISVHYESPSHATPFDNKEVQDAFVSSSLTNYKNKTFDSLAKEINSLHKEYLTEIIQHALILMQSNLLKVPISAISGKDRPTHFGK